MAGVKSQMQMTSHTPRSSASGANSTYFRDTSLKFEFRSLRSHAPPGVYVAPAAGMPLTWKGVIFVGQCASVVDTLTEAGLTNYMGEQIRDSDTAGAVAVSQHKLSGEQSATDTSGLKTEGQGSASSIGYSGWYEGGIFEFLISFPNDYPRSPPQLRFVPPPLHPQIAADGLLVLDDVRPPLQEIQTPQSAQRNLSSGKGGAAGGGHVIPLLFHVHRMFQTLRPWAPNQNPLRLMNGPDSSAAIIACAGNGGELAGEGHGWEGGEEGAGGRGDGAAVGNPAAAAMLAHARDDLYAAVRRCVASSVKRAETQARIRAGFWETTGEDASKSGKSRSAQEQRCAEQQAQKEEMIQRVLAGERGRDLWRSVMMTK